MNLYPFVKTRELKVYFNKHKTTIKDIVIFILFLIILGIIGRSELNTCIKGIYC